VSSSTVSEGKELRRLLDLAFGLFVWAAHFLIIYVGAAVACVLRLNGLEAVWAVVTLAAAALVVWHGFSRYRRRKDMPDHDFARSVTVGCDAIALVAILWQLFAIAIVPACA